MPRPFAMPKGYVPTKWDEAIAQIKCYIVLSAVMLGKGHPNIKAQQEAYQLFESIAP